MRRFLLKTLIALLVVLAAHAFAGRYADGQLDEFYLRFTGDRKGALIIGTSRAAQGIRPANLLDEWKDADHDDLFNFAFTVAHSPFGPTYLRAIRAKIDPAERDGLFVVTVDPWSLCDPALQRGPDAGPGTMPEEELMVGEQWTFTGDPNYEYLVRHAPAGWGSLLGGPLHDMEPMTTLHTDGWLEVRVDLDSAVVAKRTEQKVRNYREEMLPKCRPGSTRMRSLEELVELLRSHGRVILVRMPVGEDIARIEHELWPELNATMEAISKAHDVPYWNLMPERNRYTYTDGNHLDTLSSRAFSVDLARRLAAMPPYAH